MTPDKVIEWAREAGLEPYDMKESPREVIGKLTHLIELATEDERKSRQAAQIENEELKARIARFGMEQAIAVNKARKDERERCAKVCEELRFSHLGPTPAAKLQRDLCAAAIRALKD